MHQSLVTLVLNSTLISLGSWTLDSTPKLNSGIPWTYLDLRLQLSAHMNTQTLIVGKVQAWAEANVQTPLNLSPQVVG